MIRPLLKKCRFVMAVLVSAVFLQNCSTMDFDLPEDSLEIKTQNDAGQQEHAEMLRVFGGEYKDTRIRNMLENIVRRIVPATSHPGQYYKVTILNSQIVNAFALPSGRLYVTRGLLALANDSSEIAAVMAHEIAHVTLRHAAARTEMEARSALVTKVVADVLQDKSESARYSDRSRFSIARFSREQEFEADDVGISTLTKAGYDPYGATRFLKSLERWNGGVRSNMDMLSTHPSLKERIQKTLHSARRIGAPGIGDQGRSAYLEAIDGLAFGDSPREGLVKGRRFIHTDMHFMFEAPPGFRLENSSHAVLGSNDAAGQRLLLDVVKAKDSLENILGTIWNEDIQPEDYQPVTVNGLTAVTAKATNGEWHFRIAAIQIGNNVFRLIIASRKDGSTLEAAFQQILHSVKSPTQQDQEGFQSWKIHIVKASERDSSTSLAQKMPAHLGLEKFLVLNGLSVGEAVKAGEHYKIIIE